MRKKQSRLIFVRLQSLATEKNSVATALFAFRKLSRFQSRLLFRDSRKHWTGAVFRWRALYLCHSRACLLHKHHKLINECVGHLAFR